MTLPDKQNEALARLVGWEPRNELSRCPGNPSPDFWFRVKPDGQGERANDNACPNMATPEGANELVEFCRLKGIFIRITPDTTGYEAEPWQDNGNGIFAYIPNTQALQDSLPDAVCQAAYALYKGGYLTEKEIEK